MASTTRPFAPIENKTITYSASAAEQHVTFVTLVSNFGSGGSLQGSNGSFPNVLYVDNTTGQSIFVQASPSGAPVTATAAASTEVRTNTMVCLDVGQNDYISIIPGASATGNVYLKRGIGAI
jgi:hypothetical protein